MKVLGIDFVVGTIGDAEVRDAYKFYRETLGIQDALNFGDGETNTWTEFDTKPVAFSFGRWEKPGVISIGLAVDDVHKAVEELRAKGVTIVFEPQEYETCTMAGIQDPWGNHFILHRRKDGTVG